MSDAPNPRTDARIAAAAFAIAHVAGCDEPNSNARLCSIAEQIAFGQDGCECLNMARAALAVSSASAPLLERVTASLRAVLESEANEEQNHTLYGSGDSMGRRTCSACGFLWPCAYENARAVLAEVDCFGGPR